MIEGGKRLDDPKRKHNEPLFSIITAVRNGAETIPNTIRSIAAQCFRDFEYIVMDGDSSDATVSVLQQHNDQIDYWMSAPDLGIYDAWNKGLEHARGSWISFIGADDEYYPDALSHYASVAKQDPPVRLQYISSRVHLCNRGEIVRTIGQPWAWHSFRRYMTVAHVGSFHHRSLFLDYGGFDSSYRACGDYDLLLRARDRLRAGFLDKITARMELGGVSNSNLELALSESARAKATSGGLPRWLCRFDHRVALAKGTVRQYLSSSQSARRCTA